MTVYWELAPTVTGDPIAILEFCNAASMPDSAADNDSVVRSATMGYLGRYSKKDTQTSLILREHAMQDEDADVRSAAVSALSEYCREDADTLLLLRELAVKDESPKPDTESWNNGVRNSAIVAIAKYWHDHPGTLQLLRERA